MSITIAGGVTTSLDFIPPSGGVWAFFVTGVLVGVESGWRSLLFSVGSKNIVYLTISGGSPASYVAFDAGLRLSAGLDYQIRLSPQDPNASWIIDSVSAVPVSGAGTLGTPIAIPLSPVILLDKWSPTWIEPYRPILRAAGTEHVKDIWRFPETITADRWLSPIVQPARRVVYAKGTELVWPKEQITADKWQPTFVNPTRQIVYAKGTESVGAMEPITVDKWFSTIIQPSRATLRAKGSDFVMPIFDTAMPSTTQGRLTLTSGDPIEASASGSTLYFTPYMGCYISLFDGVSTWNLIKFSQVSISVPVGTGVYDVFAYNNNGTVTLETLAWTNTTTRATALVLQDGIYVKSGATTRKYLGTFYSSSGTCSDTNGTRYLWNYYNRIPKKCLTQVGNINWTYTVSGVWRAMDNDSTNSISVVVGVKETPIEVWSALNVQPVDGNNSGSVGIGYDTTSSNSADMLGIAGFVTGFRTNTWAKLSHATDIGLHTYYALEILINVASTVTINFYGSAGYTECGIGATFCC